MFEFVEALRERRISRVCCEVRNKLSDAVYFLTFRIIGCHVTFICLKMGGFIMGGEPDPKRTHHIVIKSIKKIDYPQ